MNIPASTLLQFFVIFLIIAGIIMFLKADLLWLIQRRFSDREDGRFPSFRVVPWIKRAGLIVAVISTLWYILGFTSCIPPAAAKAYPEIIYPDDYVEGQDFNYTAFSVNPNTFAVSDKGIYFKSDIFVYFASYNSLKAHALCYKPLCLHQHGGQDRIPNCNSYAEVSNNMEFLGVFRDHVYFTVNNLANTFYCTLVRTNLNGSEREILLPNVNSVIVSQMRIHRGVLYYPEKTAGPDRNERYTLMAMDLTKDTPEPEALFEGNACLGTFSEVLPYGNYIYYNETFPLETEDGMQRKNRYSRYHIPDKTNETLTEISDYDLRGIIGGRPILFDGSDYFELNPETKELRISELGIQKYAEQHPEWSCAAHSIRDDIAFLTSPDDFITYDNFFSWNRRIISSNGEETAIKLQSNGVLNFCSDQIVTIKDEEYYVWYNANITDFSVGLFKVKDLLAGELKPRYLYGPIDLNSTYAFNSPLIHGWF